MTVEAAALPPLLLLLPSYPHAAHCRQAAAAAAVLPFIFIIIVIAVVVIVSLAVATPALS
jgi:hypothetical protein